MGGWTVYLIECSDKSYYCGICKISRLKDRINEHNLGSGAKYTRSRIPVKLLFNTKPLMKNQAYQVEYRTKKLPKGKKIDFLKKVILMNKWMIKLGINKYNLNIKEE